MSEIILIAPKSPRRAFYRIELQGDANSGYQVFKQSGTTLGGIKVLDQRAWSFGSDKARAEKFLESKLRSKLRVTGRSRVYEAMLPGMLL
jgi:hypothetical protein